MNKNKKMGTGRPYYFTPSRMVLVGALAVVVVLQHLQSVKNVTTDSAIVSHPAAAGESCNGSLPKNHTVRAVVDDDVAHHNELVQKLLKHQRSFSIKKGNNKNRYVGLSGIWREFGYTKGAEVGVWKGDFSKYMLEHMPTLTSYILVDSWRHLENWNKPWNKENDEFEVVFQTAMQNTQRFRDAKICSVVRGTNVEAAPHIPDGSLDFVYLDGDHTLRGITFDLHLFAPKVRPGGMVCGDDYTYGQHGKGFDPTMVKPYVDVYGALNQLTIVDLGQNQFCYIVPPM